MKRRSSYKVTFLDRHGPEGVLRIKAFGYGLMVFGLTVGACLLQGAPLIMTLVLSVTLSLLAGFGSFHLGRSAGDVMQYVTAGGSSTPYEDQFSQEQALVMQRDYAGALALYEQRITAAPNEPCVRIAAADLYATHGENPKRAAELYREVQRIPEVMSGHDIYVTNKLADLYLGPLKEPGRALVEFRRLTYKYPGSTAADHARRAIANLKPGLVSHSDSREPESESAEKRPPW